MPLFRCFVFGLASKDAAQTRVLDAKSLPEALLLTRNAHPTVALKRLHGQPAEPEAQPTAEWEWVHVERVAVSGGSPAPLYRVLRRTFGDEPKDPPSPAPRGRR